MWTCPDIADLYDATEATWPPARCWEAKGWTLRDGQGGGKRVSSATWHGGTDPAQAERLMRQADLTPLFMIRQGETGLDQALEARGYEVIDPVTLYAAEAAKMAQPHDHMVVVGDHLLAIMQEVWEAGNIHAPRLAVMARVAGPRGYLLGRVGDVAAGVGFVACHGNIAMLHALEVSPAARRSGLGAAMTRAAANWATTQGADTLALMTTDANVAANALYRRLGMQVAGHYHYRILPTKGPSP